MSKYFMYINVLNTLILRRKVLLLSNILQNRGGDMCSRSHNWYVSDVELTVLFFAPV